MSSQQFGEWVVEAEIGKGPLGIVYRVHQQSRPDQRMAIKWLTDERTRDPAFHLRFQAEMALLRRLDHPCIVRYYDHGLHEDRPYYVTDWMEGGDLQTRLTEGKKPDWPETLAILMQVVSALRYAHRRGVLHRGLKPANLLQTGSGIIKVSDFGIAKLFGDGPLLNVDPQSGGATYITPEQASGKGITKRSDFYSLGAVAYALLVGKPPFQGTTVELIQKHCFVLPERPIHYVPGLPEELDALVMKLLHKEPAQRPGSGTLLLEELDRLWSELERQKRIGKRPQLPSGGSESEIDLTTQSETPEDETWNFIPPRKNTSQVAKGVIWSGLFALVVGVLVWAFFFRGPSWEELYSQAAPLIQSDEPKDWDKAWYEYMEPLSRRYPDKYVVEVQELKQRVEAQAELRRTFASGRIGTSSSEGDRFYHLGLKLCSLREYPAARRIWMQLIEAYQRIESEQRWVQLAKRGIAELDKRKEETGKSNKERIREALQQAQQQIQQLETEGKNEEAQKMRQALGQLYATDPDAQDWQTLWKGKE